MALATRGLESLWVMRKECECFRWYRHTRQKDIFHFIVTSICTIQLEIGDAQQNSKVNKSLLPKSTPIQINPMIVDPTFSRRYTPITIV